MSEILLFKSELGSTDYRQFIHSVKEFNNGGCLSFLFPNGYEASVIRHDGSYGGKSGLFEVGVLRDGKWVRFPEITGKNDDVIGWQSADQVVELLGKIRALEKG